MQALIQIIKVNDLRTGISKTTGKQWAMQDAECLLMADDGSPQHVGVLTLPRGMVGEAAPAPGVYTGTFALQSSLRDRRIEAVLTGLTAIPKTQAPASVVPVRATTAPSATTGKG